MKHLIIGAGPAGIAVAVALKRVGIPFEMVDSGNQFGGIWDIKREKTPMYKSAHFISSKTLSGFKDYPMPQDYPDYPSHRLVHSYIESYTEHHQLSSFCKFNTSVVNIIPQESTWKVVFNDDSSKIYSGIICATGITWHQNMPEFEGNFSGTMIHSFDYRDSNLFKNKKVLIIGAGNSGCDIACDAARSASKAFISLRRGYYFIPKYTFGIPSDVFKEKYSLPNFKLDRSVSQFLLNKVLVGNLENYGLPKPDHKLMESHPIMNSRLLHYLSHGDISVKKDISHFSGNDVFFTDGTKEVIDIIVAATGYKRVFPFLQKTLPDATDEKSLDLYLEVFSKTYENLFFTGGIEVSSAIFNILSLQGELIANYIKAQEKNSNYFVKFLQKKSSRKLNLKGKRTYIDSLRHSRYVDKKKYISILNKEINSLSR